MDGISDLIAAIALAVAILSALFTWVETRKTRAERIDDRVREIALSATRPLKYGISSAQLASDFDDLPTMFTEYESSGLHELAPRLRRKVDQASVSEIAQAIDTVGAHWVDTATAYKRWQAEFVLVATPDEVGDTDRMEDAFQLFDKRRVDYIDLGESLLRQINVLVRRIDARYR